MIELGVDHNKALDNILQAASKHPNSRVSKLIHSVEEERSQKNIVLLLIELAEHAEYATDFSISLKYYLDLFEQLGIGREIVLNEAGLLLLNSSKVYARRVDFVQELVERQILTLSNADKEIVENRGEDGDKKLEGKAKRTRKRLVAAIEDPFEVELVPRKFRKLTDEKRFVGGWGQEKQKMLTSRFYKIDSEQYIHPAAWMHATIVDLENEEDIDSKRNYKLYTYHVEHRYNTLVSDINFRMHFKVKDYIDEEEERLERNDDSNNSSTNILNDWPPLSEEYVKKYLDLENKALAIGEVFNNCKKLRIDNSNEDQNIVIFPEPVQNQKLSSETNKLLNQTANTEEYNSNSMQSESGVGDSINTLNVDISTNSNETTANEQSEVTIDSENDMSDPNLTDESSCFQQGQNLNSTEKSLLESSIECENTIEASTITTQNQTNEIYSGKAILAVRTENDTGLGESITDQSQRENDCSNENNNTNNLAVNNSQSNSKNDESVTGNIIGNDDEGVYFSDLDDQEHRMLSPRVVTTDVFPCIPNKKNITIIIDDEIRSLLNIADDEPPPSYTMPIQVRPSTPPIDLNIFKFHEKLLRRRLLFKLGPEMELFLQSRSMKKSNCTDVNEQRQYRPMKLFNESHEGNFDQSTNETDNNILSDGEDMEEFLGFTEEEQSCKMFHRLSRDSGVDADVPLTTNVSDVETLSKSLNNNSQLEGPISIIEETVENEKCESSKKEFKENLTSTTNSENDLKEDITCQAKISTECENSTNEITSDIDISANNAFQNDNEPENDTSSNLPSLIDDVILDTENVLEVENSKTKIQKWHEYLQPILSKARDRHHFDVFQLGTEIMNELQNPAVPENHIKSSSTTFQDVMINKDESYVSRYFLSTLLLANQNNIQIDVFEKSSEKPSAWNNIQLNLLDTKRHTVAIEDNIGIVHSKKPSRSNTMCNNLNESSVTSGWRYNTETAGNVTLSNERVKVDLNVVRPLKQIEKLPNINDDYDSGIFSNEECSS
ncbi:LIM domain-containing protein A isoform X2 [Zeugodacus cucurbitae]|nr:LIM domain-containing protein A isoform X2 [Zeugodacus cucurbitae]